MQLRSLGREDPLEEENGNLFQYSCLGDPTDRGAWWATVHGVTKSQTRLSTHTATHWWFSNLFFSFGPLTFYSEEFSFLGSTKILCQYLKKQLAYSLLGNSVAETVGIERPCEHWMPLSQLPLFINNLMNWILRWLVLADGGVFGLHKTNKNNVTC